MFWESAACAPRWKLMIYDAAIRPKLVYGLATEAPTRGQSSVVDALQLRGLRQIIELRRPYVERSTTSARVLEVANSHRFPWGGG